LNREGVCGGFVINNESGWYEGWMIHDLRVPSVAPPRADGHAAFGTMTAADASALAGMGRSGAKNDPVLFGDDPNTIAPQGGAGPRDPDRFDGDADVQRESRMRFVPSGLANEIFLDVHARPASFEPGVTWPQRLYDAYAVEAARVDPAGHGVISAVMGDVDTATDGFADNTRLFLPATAFNRFAVTREINDGLLAPRFAPSQRAWVLTGKQRTVSPVVPASSGRDGDDR
jgi:hypothetical protein